MEKIQLGLLFGGRSCEHEVSVTSARSILKAIDRDRYDVHLIGIDKSGHWHLGTEIEHLIDDKQVSSLPSSDHSSEVSLALYQQGNLSTATANQVPKLDVIFPVLHGTFGEDGTIQGVFEMANIPYVGCGVAASAIAMDKALAKQVYAAANIPQSPCLITTRFEWQSDQADLIQQIEDTLGYPLFIKPANLGSSVGISKAHEREQLIKAVEHALEFDHKLIVEASMENCHEVECAVLGNHDPIASVVGEIIPGAEFYDYQTKYIDDKTETLIPARIDQAAMETVKELSIRAFKAIDGSGLARVDFFVSKETGAVTLNEINTLPGFTPISMYPQLWHHSGIAYGDLIDRLVELAIERHRASASLKRSF